MPRSRQDVIAEAGNAMQAYQRSTQSFDDAVARAIGLNGTDLRCLDWLADGPKTAGELSAGTGLSSAATTTLIDRLERKGFVRRVAAPGDRRKVLVEMTPDAAERIAQFYGPLAGSGTDLLAGFSVAEIEKLIDWLQRARDLTDRQRDEVRHGAPSR